MNKKPIYVGINGPPGAGKTTAVDALERLGYKVHVILTYYTRPKRPDETEREYFFLSEEKFQILLDGEFFVRGTVRRVNVNGKIYRKAILKRQLWLPIPQGTDLVVCLFGRNGLNQRHYFPKMKLIYISTRSPKTLETRLTERCQGHGIDPAPKLEEIKRKYNQLGLASLYDITVYNDDTPEQLARRIARIVGLPKIQP